MIIEGILKEKLDWKEGVSSSGKEYKIGTWLFLTNQNAKEILVAVKVFGANNDKIEPGYKYNFEITIEAREYKGKYYTDVTGHKFEMLAQVDKDKFDKIMDSDDSYATSPSQSASTYKATETEKQSILNSPVDDLPF